MTRDDRNAYIDALEVAVVGDLEPAGGIHGKAATAVNPTDNIFLR